MNTDNSAPTVEAPGALPESISDQQRGKDSADVDVDATLVVLSGPNAGATVVLNQTHSVIGFHGKRWLKISHADDGWTIEALDPRVPVAVNGTQLPPVPFKLKHGDAVGVDTFEMVFGIA